ncbi:uncharacterized protein LOC103717947 [Phoenix dactylifera]|uniref:Uncharacterized protein LOC103717947 n=1 Tax=Phoenix dactylifera TaxID=42345 RepID=A0A8B8ZVV7_PHODC|nr:uncharacterized protein LOC103717947 [Phoenix dactylifera]
MWGRRLASLPSLLHKKASSSGGGLFSISTDAAEVAGTGGKKQSSFARRAVPIVLISLTGGVALSTLNDLAIFHGCTSKAIEKASQNQKIVEALGEPIVRGPWYDATLAVGHRRHTVSCTFPVSGPQGTGIFQLKAVRSGEDTWFSFLRHNEWDILIMEALLNVPSDNGSHRTFRVSLSDSMVPPPPLECKECRASELPKPDK